MAGKHRKSVGGSAWWGMVWTLLTLMTLWVSVVELASYTLVEERAVIMLFVGMAWGLAIIGHHWWSEPVVNYSRQVRRKPSKAASSVGRDGKGRWVNLVADKAVGQ